MCGRFSLALDPDEIASYFGVIVDGVVFTRRYNIAPGQNTTVIIDDPTTHRAVRLLRWGLVPSWAKDPAIGNKLINARSETAAEKPSFRGAIRKRRCIIPADAFYEWGKERLDGKKIPIRFSRRDGNPIALAGLWEEFRPASADPPLQTFTILTTSANHTMEAIHHRMPVILEPEAFPLWLDGGMTDPARLTPLLVPAPDDLLESRPVSTRLNSVQNDDPGLLDEPRDENSFL